jgi:hypothetical protein
MWGLTCFMPLWVPTSVRAVVWEGVVKYRLWCWRSVFASDLGEGCWHYGVGLCSLLGAAWWPLFVLIWILLVTGLLSHWHLHISLFISIHATTSYFACFTFLMYILNENQVRKAISLNNNERKNYNNLNINVQK